jgi:hypothetical protein
MPPPASYGITLAALPRIKAEMTAWAEEPGRGGAREWLTKLSTMLSVSSDDAQFSNPDFVAAAITDSVANWHRALTAPAPYFLDAALNEAIEAQPADGGLLAPEDLPGPEGVFAFAEPLRDRSTPDPAGMPISLLTWTSDEEKVSVDLWSPTRYRYLNPPSTSGFLFAQLALYLHEEKRSIRPDALPAHVLPLHGLLYQRTLTLPFGKPVQTDYLGEAMRAEHTCQEPGCRRCANTALSVHTVRLQTEITAAWRLLATGRAHASEVEATGERGRRARAAPGPEHRVIRLHPPLAPAAHTPSTPRQTPETSGGSGPMPASRPRPTSSGATVADLLVFPRHLAALGELTPGTASAYRSQLACVIRDAGIDPATALDELDPKATVASFLAETKRSPATAKATARQFEQLLERYRARSSAQANDGEPGGRTAAPGSIGAIYDFLPVAVGRGELDLNAARNTENALKRLLRAHPDLAATPAAELDLDKAAALLAEGAEPLSGSTHGVYASGLRRTVVLYIKHLLAERTSASEPASAVTAAPPVPPQPAGAFGSEFPLPGGRRVRIEIPEDLTGEEGAAVAAMLKVHHPSLFPSLEPQRTTEGWTIVYWPEKDPETPHTAHLTGRTFRQALAAHARAQLGPDAPRHDDQVIDAWFENHVFYVLATEGTVDLVDAGELLQRPA